MRVFAPLARVPRRRLGALALMLTGAGLTGCLDLGPEKACSVTIAPTNVTVAVNGRQAIVGTAFDCAGKSIRNKKISFSTANASVATVSEDGFVIGISVGQTTVSANANDQSATAQVTVTPELVASVVVNPPAATLRVGNTRIFTAQLRNSSGTAVVKPIQWTSSNTTVATVTQNGTVTAVGPGQAQIVAEADQVIGGSVVTVTLLPVGSCAVSPLTQRIPVGQQAQTTVTVRDTASGILLNRPINWASDNEIIATVNQNGVITARRAGTARITATTAESPTVSCGTTTVEAFDVPVDKILISQRTGSLRIGIPRLLSAAVLDSDNNVLNRPVTWTSLTPGIATITSLGLVTGNALGTARIEARLEGKADTVSFQVTRIPVGTVTVSPLQNTVREGEFAQFAALVRDSTGATVTDRPVEWLTNNPNLATVDANGRATAISQGSVVISATSEERGGSAQLFILLVPVDTIIAPPTFTLARGTTSGFTIILRNANGAEVRNRTVGAVSEQPAIAQVPSFIQSTTVSVQAFAVGETNITLRAFNATTGQAEGKATVVRVIVTAP
jgi:uncharacterized protein YjdB